MTSDYIIADTDFICKSFIEHRNCRINAKIPKIHLESTGKFSKLLRLNLSIENA